MKEVKDALNLLRGITIALIVIAALLLVLVIQSGRLEAAEVIEDKPVEVVAENIEVQEEPSLYDLCGYREFTATAYCKCTECNGEFGTDDPWGQAQSATGARLVENVSVAADFSVLPAYTMIEIQGMGVYTIHDCGGAIKGNRLDIYFDNHEDAQNFGVKTVQVRVCDGE